MNIELKPKYELDGCYISEIIADGILSGELKVQSKEVNNQIISTYRKGLEYDELKWRMEGLEK